MLWREHDDLQLLQDSAATFLDDQYPLEKVRRTKANATGTDPESWTAMARLGWFGTALPEALGGLDLGLRGCAQLALELGRHLVPDPFVGCVVMPSAVLSATSAQVTSALAAELIAGTRLVTLAWQERPAQTDPSQITTRLSRMGSGWQLSGRKIEVPTVGQLTDILVVAEMGGEPAIVVLEAHAEGVSRHSRTMADGTIASTLTFDAVPVEDSHVLLWGDRAALAAQRAVEWGRVALCAYLEGAGREAFEVTRRYVSQRVQFGQTIGSFQVIRHRLVDLDASLLLAGASWREALARIERSEDAARISASVCAAKARASDAVLLAAREGVQMHGAFGYTREADISLFLDAALRGSSWLGTADILRRHAAASPDGWSAPHA